MRKRLGFPGSVAGSGAAYSIGERIANNSKGTLCPLVIAGSNRQSSEQDRTHHTTPSREAWGINSFVLGFYKAIKEGRVFYSYE